MSKSFKNDLTGQRFGKLTVLEFVPTYKKGTYWKCRCDCGSVKVVRGGDLKNGHTKSCTCYKREKTYELSRKYEDGTYIYSRLYMIWSQMLQRCYNRNNKAYKYYGGRGIKVYEEWRSDFQAFYDWAMENGYREGLSIDRIDNDRNYEPDNCRWINIEAQQRNKRNSIIVEYNDKKMCLSEVSNASGIPYNILYRRYRLGDRGERLFRPVEKKN